MKQVSEATIERARLLMLDGVERRYRDIADALHITKTPASSAIGALHDRGQVFIARYDRLPGSSRHCAVFKFGNEPDAEPPEKANRYAWVEAERDWIAQSRAPVKPFRHWQDIALFGEVAA